MFPDFSRLRVLVVGDLMVDRYLYGSVDRISPEAPVPVVRHQRQEDRPGGAANVALNLSALGVEAAVAGAVGADEAAGVLRGLLRDQGVDTRLLEEDSARLTTLKTRVISHSQQLLRVDRETTDDLAATTAERFLSRIDSYLGANPCDLILLQDYNKGVLSAPVIEGVLAMARRRGIRTAVDPKDKNFWAYRGVDLFKPNLREIQQQCDFAVHPRLAELDRAAERLFDRLGCSSVMVTLSEHGIYTHDGQASVIHPTDARRIADVSGAGDTVISVAACAVAAGMPLADAARLANLAGAQVIALPGVVSVDLTALQATWQARS
ncbi:rfaE bifunctional protein kinase chain/domain [Lewinella marina]|uniref:Carbohydrate kinase n=1 Tax=Neolewinella marina TaxID=438751 RepID=A0A2G0CIA3_9BACT|nr:bifunctional ADP-heptose synthase [Neolewinella marina]NJB85217.1 rfaE bifunctional protein kinase chain/domain [Neolewinella marina]PHK99650.1 carbohydrate kinase [Neolewinella marina]